MSGARRWRAWRLLTLVGVLASVGGLCAAAPLPGQEGLPPELIVQDTPSLDEQAEALQACIEWARHNRPQGGFMQGLRQMFSREKPPAPVNIPDLAANPGTYAGQYVVVHGVYEQVKDREGRFRSEGMSFVRITLSDTVAVSAFPGGSPVGLPTEAKGYLDSEGGIPVLRVTSLDPSPILAGIRLARVQELRAAGLERLGREIEAASGVGAGVIEIGVWKASGRYAVRVRDLAARDTSAIRAAAGATLGSDPEQVELVDLHTSVEAHTGLMTATDIYAEAAQMYAAAGARTTGALYTYVPFAGVRGALLQISKLTDRGGEKHAAKQLGMLWTPLTARRPDGEPLYYTWIEAQGGRWERIPVRDAIAEPLDSINRQGFWYKFVHVFVAASLGNAALGMLLLALVSRIAIYPLTKKQLRSAEDMKRLQPQIAELRERYKGDNQGFQAEFWKLCKANNVNPLGGCMPLIIQMPVLIMIYQGIRMYIVQFDKASFLWVQNLAQPDMVLLIAYAASMVLFQMMTNKTNPAAAMDPQQAQQQKMMTWLMPVMFFFFFKGLPAAFILYWLGTNIVYFAQQWWFSRQAAASVAVGAGAVASSGAGGGRGLAGLARGFLVRRKPASSEDSKPSATSPSYEESRRRSEGKMSRKDPESSTRGRKRRRRK